MLHPYRFACLRTGLVIVCLTTGALVSAQTPPAQPREFGGGYSSLDARRQRFVNDWVARFRELSGQAIDAGPFYDTYVKFSTKTTFDAVTHALMTTALTDASGASLGDALDLVERLDTVKGQVAGSRGDHQFRMYVWLKEGALDTLNRSQQFKRGADNTVYHRGYPINYRQQGGAPSIQISIALDRRHADVDVDYRSSGFPAAIFNGHLTAANSDIRAGDNDNRHAVRWTGLQTWWRGFFGISLGSSPDDTLVDASLTIPTTPRVGRKDIDLMARDFLTAWLVEGNAVAAMSYVSDRAYSCMIQDRDEAVSFDLGMAPYQLLQRLQQAHKALGPQNSLEGVTIGVRLVRPDLRVVRQPSHAQFVVYDVPDDVAASFDCASRLAIAPPEKARREYGKYFGTVFYVKGQQPRTVAFLWAQENGYWKIVSWQTDAEERDDAVPPPAIATETATPIDTDPSLVQAARGFLERWLIQKDAEGAFRYLSPRSYSCYNLLRQPNDPQAASLDEAGRLIQGTLARASQNMTARRLEDLIEGVEFVNATARPMPHQYSRVFTLAGMPDGIIDAADCATRARNESVPAQLAPGYGTAYGMVIRFRTEAGEAPVLRTLWVREGGTWRITAYDVELP